MHLIIVLYGKNTKRKTNFFLFFFKLGICVLMVRITHVLLQLKETLTYIIFTLIYLSKYLFSSSDSRHPRVAHFAITVNPCFDC